MKVAIDAQLTVGTATGIGEYATGLVDALRGQGVDVVALCEPRLDPWRFDRRLIWDQVILPRRAARSGAQMLHCAAGTMPFRLRLPVVVTVHDVAWLKVQEHARPYARYYFGVYALRRYAQAQRIVVDSYFSRGELLDVLDVSPDLVDVVYPGVSADVCALERRADGSKTILVPGTVERRKNLEVLLRALPGLPGARIVSVGPPTPYLATCRALAAELGIEERVEFRGYVARAELLRLYATSAVVAVPSRYEGFGYAAAQALCSGIPAVVSDRSSLPEVVGANAAIVPVDDVAAWRDALQSALAKDSPAASAGARAAAIARFAWSASASAMRSVYEAALR
ncbi:MAG: glycosyltransferase family 4 protein [Candidatus Eremiobacteraeota bacterium]|nr:glycosyltransferase family 4 protein [Candidatus Eremiobacteraeota bacterium]